jgi:hypothetical protein
MGTLNYSFPAKRSDALRRHHHFSVHPDTPTVKLAFPRDGGAEGRGGERVHDVVVFKGLNGPSPEKARV